MTGVWRQGWVSSDRMAEESYAIISRNLPLVNFKAERRSRRRWNDLVDGFFGYNRYASRRPRRMLYKVYNKYKDTNFLITTFFSRKRMSWRTSILWHQYFFIRIGAWIGIEVFKASILRNRYFLPVLPITIVWMTGFPQPKSVWLKHKDSIYKIHIMLSNIY